MRVLIVDTEAMGLDLAIRVAEEGHEVRLTRTAKSMIGEGFEGIGLVDDWRASMEWAGRDGLIVNTGNAKFLRDLDRWRDLGFKVFGPTVASARLEIDRAAGMEAMTAAGIDLPDYKCFPTMAAAEAHVRKTGEAFVFKPMGDEEDKSLTYVGSDPADMIGWLRRKQAGKPMKGQCMLQSKVDLVAELGISGWFGPQGFLPGKWQLAFEHKPLMNGDIGPNTGEMGTVCQYVEADPMADMLMALETVLLKTGHTGDFAINCGIDSAGKAWPFEFTARCGWPAFFIQTASHKGDPARWMRDLLDGEDSLKASNDVAIGVVMAQPGWPYAKSSMEQVTGNPISGAEEVWEQVHPAGMMVGKGPVMDGGKIKEAPTYQTAAEFVLVATGLGETVTKAKAKVYRAVDAISYPGAMYRTDIGDKLEKALPTLHKAGFARGMAYGDPA